ncbi:MAG: hypothetical protein JXA95_10345 [Spirochaetales bacterium]|nr:hypothetical protein [Spirochaetales bacterium]
MLSFIPHIWYNYSHMKGRYIILSILFAGVFLSPCHSLEERYFQALIYGGESREPIWQFPISPVSWESLKNQFLSLRLFANYILYCQTESEEIRDLCGFRYPEIFSEREMILND